MGLFYSNKEEIERINGLYDLVDLQEEIKDNDLRLPEEIVTKDDLFCELYELWIRVAVEEIFGEEERKRNLFFSMEDEGNSITDFMKSYCDWMRHVDRKYCYKDVWEIIEENCTSVDLPDYIKLRVISVCVFCNLTPEELFEHGNGWFDCIYNLLKLNQIEYLKVENGYVFTLDLDINKKISKLYPKILRNSSDSECTIYISYKDEKRTIYLPPYGILRVVFADSECNCMVGIKGNLTFADNRIAVSQQGEKDGLNLQIHHSQRGTLPIENKDECLDISTDDNAGILRLTNRKLYSTRGLELTGDLPIRCYSAGGEWAWLYEDGRLKSSFGDMDGVVAVAEDAGEGLLICMQDKAVDYREGYAKTISVQEFVDTMLTRFEHSEVERYSECVSNEYMKVSISKSGKLEVFSYGNCI